jgi:hypothetical protein
VKPKFSLVCRDCSNGEEIVSAAQAKREGWKNLIYEPDGFYWTWTGECPKCAVKEIDLFSEVVAK